MANRPMTLGDLRAREGGGGAPARGPPRNMQAMNVQNGGGGGGGGSRRLFGGMDGVQEKHPRNEHYWDMWTTTFCPNFTIWSFTFLNVLLQMIVYIAMLFYTQSTSETGFTFYMLWGNTPEALQRFGMRMPIRIKEGEIWRLLLTSYVNHGFSQVVINCLGQLFAGFMLEAQFGSCRMCAFWFLTGIGANLFAATVDD
eukprot:CAMPEP_0185567722 /NCGR_PEP_ID=MMETSP0434-20130131/894_1 /TAXON_ID=626734 ORGANISM="Favella taraikaensis, Strain Fe Narragansett Bay" /NCGR_SAMPLE_ID=MMETSP0434 /ASSEMBLY_ACC=CAM_ASM_000379 /LENGTH=197 /DNA_ID=CAMNT_0028182011 /DNA_START=23 /DNA_END=616 /DNA_ORIENTATION=+